MALGQNGGLNKISGLEITAPTEGNGQQSKETITETDDGWTEDYDINRRDGRVDNE